MEKKTFLKTAFGILKETVSTFMDNKGLKLSASLAYYTLFSMAPLLLLVISLAGAFFGREAIEGSVFAELNGLVGNEAAAQIQQIIKNMELSGSTTLSLVIGAVSLIIGATTVFGDIQDSVNKIWSVKAKPEKGWLKLVKDRLLSGSIIIGLGFLLIVALVVNGAVSAFDYILKGWLPDFSVVLLTALTALVNFLVLALLFGVIYKVLPDAKIKWRDVRAGALFTAALFMLGRYVIGIYIDKEDVGSPYGAAGSLIIILIWVYYSAAILYISTSFTKVYAAAKGENIKPSDHAVYVEEKEVESDNASVLKDVDQEKEL
ncbi:YihY/virulence factor BrkB family protein [Paenimyroides baculatum]|uniref:YihY/virulence factor BrkB family protein n=1 Tax=Paenimyroides baculatum TaxID=2608000 RepID=A0A5M6C9Y2_9FLAO|nr:YihY/virulence factor BrkB family protein [Paenimyroides baculatum]KAA5531771.1 YihY/virulence factor BrkB family protein [Paenimyroides baculatum]